MNLPVWLRRVDMMAISGVPCCVLGATLFFRGDRLLPMWVGWFVGPLLWYLGGSATMLWMLIRLFEGGPANRKQRAQERTPRSARNAMSIGLPMPGPMSE